VSGGPTPGDAANAEQDLPAGAFSAWLPGARAAMEGERGSDVPCDGCTACCTASQWIRIGSGELDVLACIPPELLARSARLPNGDVLLPPDDRGHCPMLVDGACTIYEHRPQTCRAYDCRVFAAAGLDAEADSGPGIGRQARRWRFDHPTPDDHAQHAAVRAAAAYLEAHAAALPGVPVVLGATRRAVLAVQLHDLFLAPDAPQDDEARQDDTAPAMALVEPSLPAVRRALVARRTDPRARWSQREGGGT
jgi:uncharacterized protein